MGIILKQSIVINKQIGYKESMLLQACEISNLLDIRKLVKSGAEINIQDEDGMTPLLYCCKKGDLEASVYLLLNGADPKITNNLGQDCSDYAFEQEDEDMQYILEIFSKNKDNVFWE